MLNAVDIFLQSSEQQSEKLKSSEDRRKNAQITTKLLLLMSINKMKIKMHINNLQTDFLFFLVTYFSKLSTKYKFSTLCSLYSMFRRPLIAKDDVSIVTYCKLKALLK